MKTEIVVLSVALVVAVFGMGVSNTSAMSIPGELALNDMRGGVDDCCSGMSEPRCDFPLTTCGLFNSYDECAADQVNLNECTNPTTGDPPKKIKQCTSYPCSTWFYKEDCT